MRRGEVYDARLEPVKGSEQGGTRPVIIVSRDAIAAYSPVILAVPCTTYKTGKRVYPTQVLIQSIVFLGTWSGCTYTEIADRLDYEPDYIKQVGSQLWRSLSQKLGEPVSKHNIQTVLRRYQQSQQTTITSPITQSQQDWKETIDQAGEYLIYLLGDRAKIRQAKPITLPQTNSEPKPDIAVVQRLGGSYRQHHPEAENIFWLIEYSNSSLNKDLEVKSKIYAAANISEYWVINLQTPQLIVFRVPTTEGYQSQSTLTQGEINPLAFPDIAVSIKRLIRD